MSKILRVVLREPVLMIHLFTAVFGLLVAFNVDLTKAQNTALGGVWLAAAAILQRALVTPVAKEKK